MDRLRPAERSTPRCPWCHDDLAADAATRSCDGCAAPHHVACWTEAGACAACGAAAARAIAAGSPPPRLRVRERDDVLIVEAPHPSRSTASLVAGVAGGVALLLATLGLNALALGVAVLMGGIEGLTCLGLFTLVVFVPTLALGGPALRAAVRTWTGTYRLTVGPGEVSLAERALGVPVAPVERVPTAGLHVGLSGGSVRLDAPGAQRLTIRHLRADEAAWFAAVLRTRFGS